MTNDPSAAPAWLIAEPEREYRSRADRGEVLTSGMLREFQESPARYRALVLGLEKRKTSPAFRIGRAVHKLVLEGEAAFEAAFAVGGPVNPRTGKAFAAGSKARRDWLDAAGIPPELILAPEEAETCRRLRDAIRAHSGASDLLSGGWAERVCRASLSGVACQARLDWHSPAHGIVDLKTTADISWFEADARRYGYLRQFAFYRATAAAAAGRDERDVPVHAVVAEKEAPWRVGVWLIPSGLLDRHAGENALALEEFRRCLHEGRWPTGYEEPRVFPCSVPPGPCAAFSGGGNAHA